MDKFVVMEKEKQILGMFSTQEAAEAARLKYCMMASDNESQLFRMHMERTLVVKDPEKKKARQMV